jgi:hypothetical protein
VDGLEFGVCFPYLGRFGYFPSQHARRSVTGVRHGVCTGCIGLYRYTQRTRAVHSAFVPVYRFLAYFSSLVSSLARSCSFNNSLISSALHSLW